MPGQTFYPGFQLDLVYHRVSQKDEDTCYGYVQGLEDELGYFSLSEISLIRGYLGLPVERDLFFQPTLLSKIREEAKQCIS